MGVEAWGAPGQTDGGGAASLCPRVWIRARPGPSRWGALSGGQGWRCPRRQVQAVQPWELTWGQVLLAPTGPLAVTARMLTWFL